MDDVSVGPADFEIVFRPLLAVQRAVPLTILAGEMIGK